MCVHMCWAHICMWMHIYVWMYMGVGALWRSEDKYWKEALFFHHGFQGQNTSSVQQAYPPAVPPPQP